MTPYPRPSASASPPSRRPGTSVNPLDKACQHCTRRKMKCDMQMPCGSCKRQGRECVPTPRSTRPRPTYEKIQELQDVIRGLKTKISEMENGRGDIVSVAENRELVLAKNGEGGSWTGQESQITDAEQAMPSGYDRYEPSPSVSAIENRFALHDTTSHVSERAFYESPTAFIRSTVDEKLMADTVTSWAAEERHMEVINLAAGRLDFDGVAPDLAMHLLALHWNRQHFAYMISYRPIFTRDQATHGPYYSPLLLNAIFASVSKFSSRPETYDSPLDQSTAGNRFLRRVKELLGPALDQSSIPTIQAVLLLSSSLFALGNQSAAWMYRAIGVQMIFDMGLNYDSQHRVGMQGPQGITLQEFELRRRLVWCAFISDKLISLWQGRPFSFDEERMHVPHRFLDTFEENEMWMPFGFRTTRHYPAQPARAISTFTALCSLSVIMLTSPRSRIITHIYSEKAIPSRPAELLQRLSTSLSRWRDALPPGIAIDENAPADLPAPPPHICSLHLVYLTMVILLHRPFVEGGQDRADSNLIASSWTACERAATTATQILSRYRATFTLAPAPYLISYTTFVAATIHVRIAAQRGPQSPPANLLAVCMESLEENSATNTGVRKMFKVIEELAHRLGASLPVKGSSSYTNDNSADFGVAGMGIGDTGELDLDVIIRSFSEQVSNMNQAPSDLNTDPQDLLRFGEGGNQHSLDHLYGFLDFSN